MPGISTTLAPRYENRDPDPEYDHDHYRHYFYDDDDRDPDPDEDVFKSTAPSEDIWKKFELVPTPPMSPVRTGKVEPVAGDKPEWVTQFLDHQDLQDPQPCRASPAHDSLSNLSSIIIRDCMWSGFSAGQQLEKVVAAASRAGGRTQQQQQQCVPVDAPPISSLAADCVDPAAVLTFPLTGGCKRAHHVSSGSESHSDSSDDEEDEDEEDDEEEIDVVTVEHKQQQQHKSRRLVGSRQPVTITVHADPLDPCMKRFHISIHQQQHNYAAPSPDTLPDPPRKRARQDGPAHQPPPHHQSQNSPSPHLHQPRPGHAPSNSESGKCGVASCSASPDFASSASAATSSFYEMPSSPPASCSSSPPPQGFSSHSHSHSHFSSPQSSDCEDTDKRRAHNFLERKRRNDLRSRFLLLRDEIPGLADCPKTPKVAILTRATEYLQQLHAGERQKAQERKQLKARQLQLQRRLAQLRRS